MQNLFRDCQRGFSVSANNEFAEIDRGLGMADDCATIRRPTPEWFRVFKPSYTPVQMPDYLVHIESTQNSEHSNRKADVHSMCFHSSTYLR